MKLTPRNMRKIIFIIACAILLFVIFTNLNTVFTLLKNLARILTPVIVGCCIAFILNVIMRPFDRHVFKFMDKSKRKIVFKLKRILCILFAFALAGGFLVLAALVIVPQLGETFASFVSQIPSWATSVLQWLNEILIKLDLPREQIAELASDWAQLTRILQSLLTNYSNTLLDSVFSITISVVGTVFDTVLALFIAVYILMQKERICQLAHKAGQAFFPDRIYHRAVRIAHLSNEAFSNFLAGQFVEALILGALCFIGMVIFGFPYPAIVSVIIAITALVPIFGAWIGGGISALLILTVDPTKALWFVVFILVLQQLEGNLIYPKVVGSKIGLPGLLVLVAVVLGSKIGGITGMIISVPVSAIIYALFKESIDHRLQEKARKKQRKESEQEESAEEEPA